MLMITELVGSNCKSEIQSLKSMRSLLPAKTLTTPNKYLRSSVHLWGKLSLISSVLVSTASKLCYLRIHMLMVNVCRMSVLDLCCFGKYSTKRWYHQTS
jgi:hypothetical protein